MRAADPGDDLPIPGKTYRFVTLQRAQALGDYRALVKKGGACCGCISVVRSRPPRFHLDTALQSALTREPTKVSGR
jgi:hypothetical protein